jgi:hypothetical protein
MVPLLQVSRVRSPEPAPADRVRGHDLLTASSLSRLLAVTPAGAVLIVDDALTDLLARSQAGTRRLTSRHVRFVKADSRAIESLLASHRVFALPRAQYTLGHSGFDLRTDLQPRVDGLAQVVSRKPCRDLTPAWADVPELVDATQLALVADQPEARGPIVIYLGLGEHSEPRAIDWPRAALRGLSGRTYDRRRPGDAGDLARQRELDAAPDAPLFAAPIVVRLALWRVPGGPMILPVDVGTPVRGAITRSPREEPPDLALCPSTIGEIERVR